MYSITEAKMLLPLLLVYVLTCGWIQSTQGKELSVTQTSDSCNSNSSPTDKTQFCKYSFKKCLTKNRHDLRTKVCGTDGKKYKNICLLKRQSCLNSDISVATSDSCMVTNKKEKTKTEVNPEFEQHDSHQRQCRRLERKGCKRSMKSGPVCATDGKTYRNECSFWQVACESLEYITILHKGVCNQEHEQPHLTTMSPLHPQIPAMCLSTCKPGYAFVCGTDGTTYMSDCHLKKLACRADVEIGIRHRGICQPHSSRKVGQRATEAPTTTTIVPVTTPTDCRRCPNNLGYQPVCGTDSMTYYNACVLDEYSCKQNDATLQVKHDGACQEDTIWDCRANTRCQRHSCREVCGTDGRTYKSECHLRRRNCNKENMNLSIAYRGSCVKPNLEDTCFRKCFHRYQPVCGSDGVTYLNPCFLEMAQCRSADIELRYEGICQEIS